LDGAFAPRFVTSELDNPRAASRVALSSAR
jgi:hypothetical protein